MSIYIAHRRRKTSNELVTLVLSEQECFQYTSDLPSKSGDLENRVRVSSRSLEMAPFDRPHTSSYLPSILTMAISCIVCEI